MKRTAIVGVGSPFGDDRAGWLVIETLAATLDERQRTPVGVTMAALDRPGATLLDHLRGADRAVLIDAVDAEGPGLMPGTVLALDPSQLHSAARLSSHGFAVAEALALGRAMGVLPVDLVILGIAIAPAAAADGATSPAVRAAAVRLADRLRTWLAEGGPLARFLF